MRPSIPARETYLQTTARMTLRFRRFERPALTPIARQGDGDFTVLR